MTPTSRLLDDLAACERRIRALQAREIELVAQIAVAERDGSAAGECEQTERAVAMEVAAALGVSMTSARMLADDADCLVERLPAVLAALAAGRVGMFAARQIAGSTGVVGRDLLTPDVDAALAEEAAQLLPGQVRAAADARLSALDPDAAARRAEQARDRRDVWHLPKPDGVASFGATLPAEQALACWTALDGHARGRRADGDDRSIAQIMSDTLVERVTGAARADAAATIELQVVITDESLLGSSRQPAALVGHGPLPAEIATQLSANARAWVRRLLTDPLTGAVADADAKRRRFFTGAARDLIRARDRRCRNPVCNAPIRDLDHRVEWSDGGATAPDNADSYCQRCHHLKDHPRIAVTRQPHTREPDGRQHDTAPCPPDHLDRAIRPRLPLTRTTSPRPRHPDPRPTRPSQKAAFRARPWGIGWIRNRSGIAAHLSRRPAPTRPAPTNGASMRTSASARFTTATRFTTAFFATALLATALAAAPAEAVTASAAPSCHGHRATIVGTNGDDNLVGTSGRDVIVGLGGKDTIDGLAGNDWLCGGRGNDTITSGPGNDHAYGQERYDTLLWSAGNDVVDGGAGTFDDVDKLIYTHAPHAVDLDLRHDTADVGHDEHDTVTDFEWIDLSRFGDTFHGTPARETVFAGGGDDVISSGAGADFVVAAGGDDNLHGGPGNDQLIGNVGTDTIIDRQGSNAITDGSVQPSDETGLIITGPGRDSIRLANYGNFTVRSGEGVDHIDIEQRVATADVFAGPGNDIVQLEGSDYAAGVVVNLEDGDDGVVCAISCAGAATVYGGPGSNVIDTQGAGAVTITLGHEASVLAPTGLTLFDFNRASTGHAVDTVIGSSGDDEIMTRQGADHIDAGDGDDTVNAGQGQDTCLNAEHMISCEITS